MKVSELMDQYMALREQEARLQADYEASVAPVKAKKEKIERALLGFMDKMGVDKLNSRGVGTFYRSTRTTASVADREVFMNFVKQNQEWELLEVRASKTNVDAYLETHQELPPGVNVNRFVTARFQRSAHTEPANV